MGQKNTQIKSSSHDFIKEGRVCDCCSQRSWGLKKGKLSNKKVSNIIATRDGTKKNIRSGSPKKTSQEQISLFVQKLLAQNKRLQKSSFD